jgi:hypothetical protein
MALTQALTKRQHCCREGRKQKSAEQRSAESDLPADALLWHVGAHGSRLDRVLQVPMQKLMVLRDRSQSLYNGISDIYPSSLGW